MTNLLISERDQIFTLYEMLGIDQIFRSKAFARFSHEQFDMMRKSALKMALEEVYPAFRSSGTETCTIRDGHVHVPKYLHKIKTLLDPTGLSSLIIPCENGGQGLPLSMFMACCEPFMHHATVMAYTNRPLSTADLVSRFGTDEQKRKYLEMMVSGKWGGPIAVTEPDAGSDVTSVRTRAVLMPDGSYRLTGAKTMITNGDSDLFSNMLCTVMARVEGAPPGMDGLSLFLVPKYLVNDDGSQGRRNDYQVGHLADKMGLPGWAVCDIVFGENGDCHGELIGGEGMAIPMIFDILPRAQLCIALISTGTASAAYLHAVNYARQRVQGSHFLQAFEPDASKLAIIDHPDVRRMLMTMKSSVEAMRAFTYYCGLLADRAESEEQAEEKVRLQGLLALLVPVCRVACADTAFRVTETAMQVMGSAGYMTDHPMGQFMRDIKPASLYEGPNGIQALQLFAMGMGVNGENFITLLGEIGRTIAGYLATHAVTDLAQELQESINVLGETGMFFSSQAAQGKVIIAVANAYPWIRMLGLACFGWMLLWQAGTSAGKLSGMINDHGIDSDDAAARTVFINDNQEAAFYEGKLRTARFFIKHCLPEAHSLARSITSGDLSMIDMPAVSF